MALRGRRSSSPGPERRLGIPRELAPAATVIEREDAGTRPADLRSVDKRPSTAVTVDQVNRPSLAANRSCSDCEFRSVGRPRCAPVMCGERKEDPRVSFIRVILVDIARSVSDLIVRRPRRTPISRIGIDPPWLTTPRVHDVQTAAVANEGDPAAVRRPRRVKDAGSTLLGPTCPRGRQVGSIEDASVTSRRSNVRRATTSVCRRR